MGKFRDLRGQQFGRLYVISVREMPPSSRPAKPDGHRLYLCECECGEYSYVRSSSLISGNTQSCGCLKRERVTLHCHSVAGAKPGGKPQRSPTYYTWRAMRDRCANPNSIGWKYYGGRGLIVDRRWEDFRKFLADMGERPAGTSLDRIVNDLGYFKGNCRWATPKEQAKNRSRGRAGVSL